MCLSALMRERTTIPRSTANGISEKIRTMNYYKTKMLFIETIYFMFIVKYAYHACKNLSNLRAHETDLFT